ncbi:MAG: DegT/DnrJ/EryC1/StrS family aminotransferase [Candidatus Verstraetearchaeota archaeon]|nr:DegT/DnrJ/EryC1/StrS family aminotransferase [Candidatus Verstraetearchaeota archaeon]
MVTWKIPLYKVYWEEDDVEAVTKIIKRGMYWAVGPEIEEFEKIVSQYVGTKYAVAFNSGTSALHATMIAIDLKPGEEVITPSFTFIATCNAPLFVRARPVFADIEEETFGLDPASVLEKIGPKTRAVMPIHYGGMPCKHIEELRKICEEKGLILIEDAAESLGARINGKPVGSFGHAAILSFCGNKVITTGEGGMVLTNSGEMYEKLKLIRSHGRLETEPYFLTTKTLDYVTLGFNWRIPTIVAALGISQMRKLDKVIEMRRKNADYLTNRLKSIEDIIIPHEPPGFFCVYQMYTIRVKNGLRDKLREHLAKKQIMSKVYFEPAHLTYFYKNILRYSDHLPVTEKVSKEVLTLPLYPTMTKDELDYIVESIKEFFESNLQKS